MQNLNHRLLFFAILVICENCIAQCPIGDITLTSQMQIDNFPQTYPNCHHLSGSIFISETDASNLDSLSQIDSIDLTFNIVDNLQLTNIKGLKNLRYIQDFTISGSPLVTDMKGLDSLKTASNSLGIIQMSGLETFEGIQADYVRQFVVINCDKLVDLRGLEKLGRVSTFNITENENLVSLTGVNPNLIFGDHFTIQYNPKLIELADFENLESVYDLRISDNPLLTNLDGLKKLTSAYYFRIENNASLENLDDLSQMDVIEIGMFIINNPMLTSIEGLANLDATLLDTISILNNDTLSMCNMKSLCDYLNLDVGGYSISNNAASCNDKPTILAQCTTTATLPENSHIISYFPNPSSDVVYFKGLEGNRKLSLFNITGRFIESINVNGDELVMPVSHLAEGIYFLKSSDLVGNSNQVIKLLVNH